jgi:hypothetical protein
MAIEPLLNWEDVAKILRLERGANDNEENLRKRKAMRIMREAGAFDLGRSDWRISEAQLSAHIKKVQRRG